MNWADIGKRIRRQREALGYTREELAEQIDVTPKFCSDIELGVKGMSVTTLCRLSDALNLSVDYILFGKNEKENDPPSVAFLKKCPEKKLPYLEDIIKTFIKATENDM